QHDTASARLLFRESLELYRAHGYGRGVVWVLIHLGWLALDTGRRRAAERFLQRAHSLSEQLGDRLAIARCLQLLGYLAWWRHELDASRSLHLRSLALSRELGDRWGTGWALHRLCVTLWTLAERGEGDAAAIRSFVDEALTVWHELGERRHFAFSLCDLGIVASMQGQFEEALLSVAGS